jgi:hypothetical protein
VRAIVQCGPWAFGHRPLDAALDRRLDAYPHLYVPDDACWFASAGAAAATARFLK